MATSVTTSLPTWLTGGTYDANGGNDLRNSTVTAFFFDEGIISGGGTIGVLGGVVGGAGLLVAAGTGMNVTVQAGSFVVPNTASAIAGGYAATLAQLATLTVATADPVNPRIDIVCAYVSDVGSSASFGAVAIFTGTPAGSPVAPSAPANSITLGQISVPANTTTITSGLITDTRPFTVATGGVLPAPKSSVNGYRGQLAYDKASDSFYHNTNVGGPKQARVLPFAPQTAVVTSGNVFTGITGFVTMVSLNVTCDGNTDLDIFAQWPGFSLNFSPSNPWRVEVALFIDNAQVDAIYVYNPTSDASPRGGGNIRHYTSSVTGDTPSPGPHTVSMRSITKDIASATAMVSSAFMPITLRVAPATL